MLVSRHLELSGERNPNQAGLGKIWGFPGGANGKESACSVADPGSIPGSGRSPGEGNGKPTPVFLPGESYGQRILAGYSP